MAELSSIFSQKLDNIDRERALALILPHPEKSAPFKAYKELLRRAGLRLTRQRIMLGRLLYSKGNRHVTAEALHHEAVNAKIPVSLTTVYNTLHQFTEAGLLREIGVAGSKAFFDTNSNEHHHFFVEDEEVLIDIPNEQVEVIYLPEVPLGFEIVRIEVVVRLRRKNG